MATLSPATSAPATAAAATTTTTTTTPVAAPKTTWIDTWNGKYVALWNNDLVTKCLTLNETDSTIYKVAVVAASVITLFATLPLLMMAYTAIKNCVSSIWGTKAQQQANTSTTPATSAANPSQPSSTVEEVSKAATSIVADETGVAEETSEESETVVKDAAGEVVAATQKAVKERFVKKQG